jgi:hypothetical protein
MDKQKRIRKQHLERVRKAVCLVEHYQQQADSFQSQLAKFLYDEYGVDPREHWTLDAEQGVLIHHDATE